MRTRLAIFAASALLMLSCGPKKAKAPVVLTRDFPMAEIPMMITQPAERMQWLGQHFWDRFTATDSLYFCDSLTVNGVPLTALYLTESGVDLKPQASQASTLFFT